MTVLIYSLCNYLFVGRQKLMNTGKQHLLFGALNLHLQYLIIHFLCCFGRVAHVHKYYDQFIYTYYQYMFWPSASKV